MTQATGPEQIDREIWKQKALDLRRQGFNYRAIAAKLEAEGGPGSHSRAYELVVEGLQELRERTRESANELRTLEEERIDGIWEELWPRRGKLGVVDRLIKLLERRARLRGLDAPKRIEATGGGGSPLLPPGSVFVRLVAPGEPIPIPPAPAPSPNLGESSNSLG